MYKSKLITTALNKSIKIQGLNESQSSDTKSGHAVVVIIQTLDPSFHINSSLSK